MAIDFDASAQTFTGSGDTLTFSHTCSGSDRFLLVFVYAATVGTGGGSDIISDVTYNGVSMTRIPGATLIGYLSTTSWYAYYMVNPDTGTNDVVVSASITADDGFGATSLSYTGASQTGQPDGSAKGAVFPGGDGDISITISTDGSWMTSGGRNTGSSTLDPVSGVTEREESTGIFTYGDSNGPLSPGSNTQSWSPDNVGTFLQAVSFSPAAASSPTGNMFLVM